jgi:curli biogenesis system outer membrane secretion channel CsgG
MKRLILFFALFILIAGVAVDAYAAEKPRVGVLRFTNHTTASWWGRTAGTELQDMLINELASTKAFSVLERKELDKVISEQKLSESGLVDEKTKLRPGRIKVAKYLIAATVSSFEENTAGSGGGVSFYGFSVGGKKDKAYIAVDLKVLDTETGEVADSRTVEATSEGGGMRVAGGLFGVHGNLDKYEKTPAGKAIRACIIEISEYLECSLANPDSDCLKKYAAKETKRKEKTKKAITLDE